MKLSAVGYSTAVKTVAFVVALFALSASSALASRGHVFSSSFGTEGSGPGQLSEPFGVAVNESTRDVYVADFGNNRLQRFSFNAGSGEYEFASQITAADGAGTGDLTAGSSTIESVLPSSGAFVVGQTITAPGIPAETKITAVEAGGATLTISNPVQAGGIAVTLSAEQPLVEPRSTAIDNDLASPSHGDVYVSSGPEGETVVDKFSPSGEFLDQISHSATTTGTGDLEAGSSRIKLLSTSAGAFLQGQTITGAGIPAGTTIQDRCEECDGQSAPVELILSNPVEAGGTGVAITAPSSPFELVNGLAVDPSGNLFILELHAFFGNSLTIDQLDSAAANEPQQTCIASDAALGGPLGQGLAVDPGDDFYANLGNAAVELDSHCAIVKLTLGGEVSDAANGISRTGLAVESSSGDPYIDNLTSIGRFTPAAKKVERFGTGHLASEGCGESRVTCLGGVAVSSATGEVFAAVGSPARVAVFALEEPAPPKIENEAVSAVSDDSATLEAELNPLSLPAEAPTGYRFQYGPCTGDRSTCAASPYTAATPAGSLPPSFEIAHLSVSIHALQHQTAYHFRLLAENAHGSVTGPELTITTASAAEFSLLDARQWEMVSPSEVHGALIEPLGRVGLSAGATTQTAVAGGAIAYPTNAPTESEAAGASATSEVLSTRGPGGWSSGDVAVPHAVATGVGAVEARLFSEDLSKTIVQPRGSFVPLSEDASEQTAYLRDNATGAYTPLVTGCPAAGAPCPSAVEAHADVLPGTVFGQLAASGKHCPAEIVCGPEMVGSAPNLQHTVLTNATPLIAGAPDHALYEWNAARSPSQQLQPISLLPAANPAEPAQWAPQAQLGVTVEETNIRGAISADGTHVFFTSEDGLYMRDTVTRETIQVDTPDLACNACGAGAEQPEFRFASADGNRVFFRDSQKLTADGEAYAPGTGHDLYVCEIHERACKLTDLTPSAGVLGSLTGASDDGKWAYFVSDGALAPGAVPGACGEGEADEQPVGATCNLYVAHYEAHAEKWGPLRLVTVLSGLDAPAWTPSIKNLAARVAPAGRWLAFMSQRSLTGYQNLDAVSGQPDQEVYLYDAERDHLLCASCDPSGARPHGREFGEGFPLSGTAYFGPHAWLAADVPAWPRVWGLTDPYQPRYLSDAGRLFFNSFDALVPKDVNGNADVYEYEPEGTPAGSHACTPGSSSGAAVYAPARTYEVEGRTGEEGAGCVGLISSGSSSEESAFSGASASGADVFFISTTRLSPLDTEGGRTMYDAHECTASTPCPTPPGVSPPPCSTEASCKAAPSPQSPIFGPSGSATFSGPGNIALVTTPSRVTKKSVKCKKGFVKNKKGLCLKKKKSKKAKTRKSDRFSNNRGAHR